MSPTAQITSHRKPRPGSASRSALRIGVAGGVLSTLAVAGAAVPANAEPVNETIEMPTLTSGLAGSFAKSADATQQVALDLELQAQENTAATKAAQTAKKTKAEAEKAAEATRRAAAEKQAAAAHAKAVAAAHAASTARTQAVPVQALALNTSSSGSTARSATAAPQATGSAAAVVAFAKAQVGDAYVMGATGPNAWDCSGLVQAAFRQIGVDLPRVSQAQSTAGTQVGLDNLQPGDILYWGGAGSASHVAIYVGGGQFVGAQNPSVGVVQHDLSWDQPSGAVRVL